MREHDLEDAGAGRRGGWFVAAAGAVGDLDHPFYAEERQRDVWNEASAVGLQLALLLGLAAATAMLWLGGGEALPYAATLLAVLSATAGVTLAYARRLGVRVEPDVEGLLRLRLVPYGVLLVLFLVAAVRSAPADGFGAGFARGAVLGSVLAVVGLAVSALRARRSARRGESG